MAKDTSRKDGSAEQEVRELLQKEGYSEIVIEHWLHPRNLGVMKHYDGHSKKITSSCGDSMWIWLEVRNNTIQNATYLSDICLGAVSSGSMVTEMVRGKTIPEALRISPDHILKALGGLPENLVHCATLANSTLRAAIRDYTRYKDSPWKRLYQQES
jgi:nitrogen fixation NifU-like protein